ncbi:MAG: M42 family metallopeptidase [Aggregatilineales bacterium]
MIATTLDKTLIKTLVEAWGPSGNEHEVRALIQHYVQSIADEVRVDAGGNLICRIGHGGAKVMIAAHMDEIGFVVHHIDREGYARFSMLGGLFPITLHGNRVRFADGTIGVIGVDDWYHATQVPKLTDYYIDFSTGADQYANVKVGDVGTMWREYAERGDRIIAKSLDDRIGCVVAIETIRRIAEKGIPHELYFVFTTQEEVGLRGARTSAVGVAPDYAIALDVTPTGDQPKTEKTIVRLGGGAAIKARDSGHIVPPAFKNLLVKRAETAHIPYQMEVLDMGTTDAAVIQLAGAGIPSAAISIPVRFVHTTSETVDVHDIQACIDLLAETLTQPLDGLR